MEKLKLILDDKGKIELWMDGCTLDGIRSIEVFWEIGEIPYHKIEFATPATKIQRKYSAD
jgi:hypothetical protein